LFTLSALVHGSAERFGTDTALSDGAASLSFAQLRRAALDTAAALRAHGVERGDRVGVCMAKSVDQAVAILGILLADAVLVPLPPELMPDNYAHVVSDSGMRLAITDDARAPDLRRAAPELPLLFGSTAPAAPAGSAGLAVRLADLRAQISGESLAHQAISEDLAAIIYSSGSTGRPKGVMVTHRNLWDGAHITARYLGTARHDRIGSVLSLNFDYGLNQLWQSLLTGARLCLHDLVFPKSLFSFLAEDGITVVPVMPAIISRMFDPRLLRGRPELDLRGVRTVCSSGGAVSPTMIDDLTSVFPRANIFLMYGLTEAFRSTFLDPKQLALRPGSIGKAIPEVEILVLDENLRETAPGEQGELVHRGGCVAKGYWNAPAETAMRFRTLPQYPGETVVFSGDLVTRDTEGYLYFVGRRDCMIKTSGFRVSPTEVEQIAVRFAGIQACVAVGVPNIEIGADIALAYTTTCVVDESQFLRFLSEQLPRYMVPRFLFGEPSFPLTGNQGKIDRQAVAATIMRRLGCSPAVDTQRAVASRSDTVVQPTM
jgi:amino acid adenylation domain-containing protein